MRYILGFTVGVILLVLPAALTLTWSDQALERLERAESASSEDGSKVAVAARANEDYCTPELQKILRRVLQSCGLLGKGGGGRGCQPVEAKNVATMRGSDFNALFVPMKDRGGIVQFDQDSAKLDAQDKGLVERVFANRRGASYFLVVARASPEGSAKYNSELSRKRAEAVLDHLRQKFEDPELEKQVGLLWLGEEYAQLDPSFCDWTRSGSKQQCSAKELNRSAFVAWIDCRL